jgi:hypothetical protein
MSKINVKEYKEQMINKIVSSFKEEGNKFTCLASFDVMKEYAEELCVEAFTLGYSFSKSKYFPFEQSVALLISWAARRYYEDCLYEEMCDCCGVYDLT